MMKKWWMESVGYQIYPKSFFDANHDGIGDLPGILAKLGYLHELGVNLIWICPFYDSPMDDNGYDVRDFFKVADIFGDIEHIKAIIREAHQLGIRVILDLVLNHTSDEHPWFIESRKSKDNPYRDFYIWHEGRIKHGKKIEPTNWASFFGGSCWRHDPQTDSYYMKIFSDKMPDLNWENPEVRQAMADVAKWWLDLGVDGFRIDAVSHLQRDAFVDSTLTDDRYVLDWKKFSNLPKVHDHVRWLHNEVFEPYDCLTIGETGGEASIEEGLRYASFDAKALSMVFNFDHNWCNNLWSIDDPKDLKTDVIRLKQVFAQWQEAFKDQGWLPLNWLNHDQPRLMSHYGSRAHFKASGKMLATALHMMRGTPFIYQGEEIGMTNHPFENLQDFRDIASINHYHELMRKHPDADPAYIIKKVAMTSRDHPRTPVHWDDTRHAGFSTVRPWIDVTPNHDFINIADQMQDQDSIWHHYRKLIQLRLTSDLRDVIIHGTFEMIDVAHPSLYVYKRHHDHDQLLVVNNFTAEHVIWRLPADRVTAVIIQNYPDVDIRHQTLYLRPYESIVFKTEAHT